MTLSPAAVGIQDKRRHARQAASLPARIRFGESAAMAAEIRDFCETGLYVSLRDDSTPDAVLPALAGTPVQVEFAVARSGVFLCHGRVARITQGGVGVLVPAMPTGALQALRSAGGRVPRPAGSGLSARQAEAHLQACIALTRDALGAAMQEFFRQAMARLGEASQDEPTFLERSRYDHAIQELLENRGQIENAFFSAALDRIRQPDAPAAPSKGPARNKLALVEEDEFEDWLNLSAVIKQIEVDAAAPLHEFEQRYGRLSGMPADRKSNPFGPESLCRSFQHAIQEMDCSNAIRAVLYKALGQALSQHAPTLYRQLSQALASLAPVKSASSKPAPADRESPAGDRQAPVRAAAPSPPGLDMAEIATTLNALFKQDPAGAAQTPESIEYSLDRILATLNQSSRGTGSAFPAAAGARRQSSAAPGWAAAQPDVLHVVDRLQQTARQLVGHARTPQGGATRDAALPEAGLRELLAALDGLPPAGLADPGTPALAEQLTTRLAATRLSPAYRQILDVTSGLLNRARADFVPSSDVEQLVKRLERPLLELALQDPGFPAAPGHPARQMLDLIEQYTVAADDAGKLFDAKLHRFLSLLVDRVCDEAGNDSGIFERVCDPLERVLRPILQIRRTRVARLQEASEGRERIRAARSRANLALEERLAGREVPAMLLRLLDAGWRQYLVLLEMRQGAQGDAWGAALAVLDRLLAWLGPAGSDISRNTEAVRALLGEIERGLATVNVDTAQLAAFVDELGDRLARNHALPSDPDVERVFVPAGRLAAHPGEPGDLPPHARLVERLRVGDWWEFSQGGRRVPMQLIWVSQPPAACAFANRSATSKLEFSLADLLRKIQDGLAKPGKDLDLPLMERSEHALFDETYQDLVHQAIHDPLTGLLNRKGFMQHLGRQALPEGADKTHAVGVIEFDQFRLIHNTCGEAAAERLTRSLANEVRALLEPTASLAVFREDTLALLLPNCSRVDGCPAVDTLLGQVKDYHFQHEQHSYRIGFNVGISEYDPARFTAAEAMRRADSACIAAKAQGRNRMQVYEQTSPQLQTQESLMDWAGRLDSYLQGSGLYLRCQQVMPVGAHTALLPYYEILLGIEGDAGLAINPSQFIPAVEHLQRSHEVDIWVMRKVFEWIGANQAAFASLGGFAINLSATSLSSPEVAHYLQEALTSRDFPASKIIFEITETAAIESYGAAQTFIREIRRHGCKFSLDDFGSGFTSYSHLKNLRTDALKIDGSFVKDMLKNPGDYAMVKSMNDIAHSLGLRTVAEYVESVEILEALREIGVDYAQGYAIHKPCRIDEILPGRMAGTEGQP